jgi:hypothetical protein
MAQKEEVVAINANIINNTCPLMEGTNLVKCNKNKDVYKFIKAGKKYVIELPATNTILNVVCTFAGTNACDMRIKTSYVDNVLDPEIDEYTISYQYSNFDRIHYTSFSYLETCNLYMSVDDIF